MKNYFPRFMLINGKAFQKNSLSLLGTLNPKAEVVIKITVGKHCHLISWCPILTKHEYIERHKFIYPEITVVSME